MNKPKLTAVCNSQWHSPHLQSDVAWEKSCSSLACVFVKTKEVNFNHFWNQLYLSPGVPGIRRDENTDISICQLGSDHTWIQNTEK